MPLPWHSSWTNCDSVQVLVQEQSVGADHMQSEQLGSGSGHLVPGRNPNRKLGKVVTSCTVRKSTVSNSKGSDVHIPEALYSRDNLCA